ncbi:type II CAAX endopeptidase family protein [Streptomyces racemochromogenes]|uniref:Type II CAAX endopeptidase family protein n=1 Tax=Streptomyces racemochromogenes TaxID=67353 RepID=A0ABW7PDI3_9ACTN
MTGHQEYAPGSTADIAVDLRRIDETYAHTGVRGARILHRVIEAYTRVHLPEKPWKIRLLRVAAPKTIPRPWAGFDADPDATDIEQSIPTQPPQDLRPLFELARRTEGLKPLGHGFTTPVAETGTHHHGCLSPVQEETMTTPPTTSRLLGIGWCALVPLAVVAVYLGLGTVAVSLVGEPIVATCVLGLLVAILVGSVRIQRPQWLAHAPAPQPRVEVPRFGWTAVGCAVLAFLAGQSTALWIYATTGSTGFDTSTQTRHAAGLLTTLLLAMVAAPAGEEALFRGLVYPLLRKRVGILASTLVTAVVFGLLHGNAVQFASTLPLAVLLALIYEHTRVLWPCVLLHLGFNLAAALVPAQVLLPLANPVSAAFLYLAFAGCAVGLYRRVAGLTAPGAVKASGDESAMQ